MRPVKKRNSPYDKMPKQFFNSHKRRLFGYILMLTIFGIMMFIVAQDLKTKPDPIYEVVSHDLDGNIDNIVNLRNSKADKEIENLDLAGNLAKAPDGKAGLGVAEAPKGGIANEAPVVGSDEEKIVGSGNGKKTGTGKVADAKKLDDADAAAIPGKVKGYKADKEDDGEPKGKKQVVLE